MDKYWIVNRTIRQRVKVKAKTRVEATAIGKALLEQEPILLKDIKFTCEYSKYPTGCVEYEY